MHAGHRARPDLPQDRQELLLSSPGWAGLPVEQTGRSTMREQSQQSRVLGGIPMSAESHPGARTNPEAVGACSPLIISELGYTWPEVEDLGS